MAGCDVYLYGMTVLSTIHKLKDSFPPPDKYQEITQTVVLPGGEAGNGAIVLSNLGLRVRLDGCFLGDETAEPLRAHLERHNVDCSRLQHLAGFPGWRDIVFCDGQNRTVFGWFVQNLFGERKLWSDPCETSIREATCVALDPFFGDASRRVAELCTKHGTPYATIDCRHDGPIARSARAIVCSREFLEREYPGQDPATLLEEYRRTCRGLVIFTFGGTGVVWSRSDGTGRRTMTPYNVPVVDTLGAGDTFRAGIVYGIVRQMDEDEVVRFASACAAVSCTRFPSVQEPPSLDEVMELMRSPTRS